MKITTTALFLLALLLCGGSLHARQVVMDFDHLAAPGALNAWISPLNEDGLRLANPDHFYVFGPGSPRNTGHKAMANQVTGSNTTLTAQSGAKFTLLSMRLSPYASGSDSTVTFTGNKAAGGTVTATLTTGTSLAGVVRTFPANFNDLTSVTWNMVALTTYHQFDDITVVLPPEIRISAPQTVTENSGSATVGLTLSEPLAFALPMTYLASNGTAVATTDFLANGQTGSTFNIPQGQTSWSMNVDIIDDTLVESLEQFTIGFTTTSSTVIFAGGVSTTTVKIASDDGITGFPGWMSAHGLTAGDALTEADPNGDGIKNLESWLCRINPAGPSPASWLERRATFVWDSANRPALRLIVPNPLPSDVRITFEEATNLSAWSVQAQRTGWGLASLWAGTGASRISDTISSGGRTLNCSGSQSRTARPNAWLRLKYEHILGGGQD